MSVPQGIETWAEFRKEYAKVHRGASAKAASAAWADYKEDNGIVTKKSSPKKSSPKGKGKSKTKVGRPRKQTIIVDVEEEDSDETVEMEEIEEVEVSPRSRRRPQTKTVTTVEEEIEGSPEVVEEIVEEEDREEEEREEEEDRDINATYYRSLSPRYPKPKSRSPTRMVEIEIEPEMAETLSGRRSKSPTSKNKSKSPQPRSKSRSKSPSKNQKKRINKVLKEYDQLSTFRSYEKKLNKRIKAREGEFTVFAPTNQAFAELGAPLKKLLRDDPELLKEILEYHVVSGIYSVDDLDVSTGLDLNTLQGDSLSVINRNGVLLVGDPKESIQIVPPKDIWFKNGVIHPISAVLAPPSLYDRLDRELDEGVESELETTESDISTRSRSRSPIKSSSRAALLVSEEQENLFKGWPKTTIVTYLRNIVNIEIPYGVVYKGKSKDIRPAILTPPEMLKIQTLLKKDNELPNVRISFTENSSAHIVADLPSSKSDKIVKDFIGYLSKLRVVGNGRTIFFIVTNVAYKKY